MSMFSTAAMVVTGASGCSVYAQAPSRPRSSEFHSANSTLRFGLRPGRQRVIEDARRLVGPVGARGGVEVRGSGMVVDIADEQDGQRSFLLRREGLAPRRGEFGRHDPVERTVRIALARLVIEREDDLSLHVAVVVVVLQVRRTDSEADEDHWTD